MIARLWHGRTRARDADAYLEFLKAHAIPDYRSTPGNRGVYLLRRIEGDVAHFCTLTHWDDLEAVRAFAGDPVERAKYYPEDAGFLLEFEATVQHYELFPGTG